MKKVVKLSVILPEDLHKKLKIKAALEGRSQVDVIREFIAEYVKDIEPEKFKKKAREKR